MSDNNCYNPIKGVDDKIADRVPSWNSYYVANLRGIYDEQHDTPLQTENISEAVNTLLKFRRELQAKDAKRLSEAIHNPVAAFNQLKSAFTAQERFDRTNMLAGLFSSVVDTMQEEFPSVDRSDIIDGFTDQDGKFQGGPANIYARVYEHLREEMQEYANNGYKEEVDKYRKVFKNWGALIVYANDYIKQKEGKAIAFNLTFATDAEENSFDESSDIESYTADESTRESWQENKDSVSPIGTISKQVRLTLSRLTNYNADGEVDYDDLGYARTLSPTSTHQALMEILRGMQSEEDMISLLEEAKDIRPYIGEILDLFEQDPILRTQFFVDFSKDFQLYGMQNESKTGNSYSYKNPILNKLTRKKAFSKYLAALQTKRLKAGSTIFRYEGNEAVFNSGMATQLASFIIENIGEPTKDEDKETMLFDKFTTSLSKTERIEIYKVILPSLGISMSETDYDMLAQNTNLEHKLNELLKELPKGLTANGLKEGMSFMNVLNKTIGGQEEGYLKEKIGKIFQITESLESSRNAEGRINFQGNTYFSDVQSSYLGRFIGSLRLNTKKGNDRTLKDFLDKRFGDSEFFKDSNGKIYNKWLYDLYYSKLKNKRSFANNFTFKKFLGDDNQKWEDFTAQKQALTLLNEYFSEGKDYAWYPVFILGDSNASKYLKAPRYSKDVILEGLYNVYLQEKTFQRKLKEVKNSLEKEGKSLGSLKWIDDDKFGLLPFLNGVKIDQGNIKESVKKAIEDYFNSSFEEFKEKLRREGVLDRDKNGNYRFVNKLAQGKGSKEDNLEANLRDYYFNTRFATIQQMELMTVNPIFYQNGNTTDLQKRYKEIHASGNRLSTQAINPWTGELFSKRPYQTTVLFNEVKTNTEDTNSDFMKVIKAVYGKDSEIYKKYTEVDSTDGQGYRTPESYRAVMGMAGKWTKKCEDAYNELNAIRAEIRANNGTVTEEQSERLSELMVTFQPIKPFIFTWEKMSNGLPIPVQVKYAEVMVVPELMPKGKLRSMMEWAVDKGIDVITSTSAVKVGGFGAVDIASAKDDTSVKNALDGAWVHNLSYNDYVIQTNVPEHVQESRLFATQSRKIIFANLRSVDENGDNIYYNHYINRESVNLGKGQVPLNAYNLNRFYNSLIDTNILEDLDKFSNIIDNPEKVRNALIQMTINNSRESKDNLRGYGKGINSDFLMPLFEGGIEHDTAALLLSMFKKQVNKQKIMGGSAVQVSAFGINGYDERKNLQFVKDPKNDKNILYAEIEIPWDCSYTDINGNKVDLNFSDWCKSDGSLKLGKELSEDDSNYNDYLSFKNDEGKVCKPLIEERFPGILSFISVRIPTEEKYSMINCKVVRFSRKINGGGTIRVPLQGVTIAGFDFDIDKLYFMRREYKYNANLTEEQISEIWNNIYEENPSIKEALLKARRDNQEAQELISDLFRSFYKSQLAQDIAETENTKDRLYKYWKEAGLESSPEDIFSSYLEKHLNEYVKLDEYDFNKPAWDKSQTRVGRNNVLITLMQRRLEDPQTIKERTTPGGFFNVRKAAKYMRELMGIEDVNYDYSDPWTLVVYNQQNQVAGKLIGIFANQNANHAMASLMKEFRLTNPIAFGKHTTGLINLLNPEALTKELLAAAVDAVKEPSLNFLNLNTITADSAGMLCRLGYSSEEIGLLMNQPIIRRFCNYCMNNNFRDIDTAINNILDELKPSVGYDSGSFISSEMLEDNIKSYTSNPDLMNQQSFKDKQAQVLELFRTIYATAKEVSSFVTNTKFTASNAVKSTFGGMYAQQEKVKDYVTRLATNRDPRIIIKVSDFLDSPITLNLDLSDIDKYMEEVLKNPFSYEQVMYDANVKAVSKLGKYFPYNTNTYSNIREFMSSLTKSGLNEETIDDVHSHLLVYMASKLEHCKFNPNESMELTDGDKIPCKEYYTKYVPLKINKMLEAHKELSALPIFRYMEFNIDDSGNLVMQIGNVGALTPVQKEEIRDSWEMMTEDSQLREVAEDLYMYSFYQSGFGFGAIGFNHLAPLELKLNLMLNTEASYVEFLNDVLNGNIGVNNKEFAVDFIKSHRDNTQLIYQPKKKQLSFIKSKVYSNNIAVDSFEINYNSDQDNVAPFILKSTVKSTFYKPAIMIDNMLYVADNVTFNMSLDGKMRYSRVDDGDSKVVTLNDIEGLSNYMKGVPESSTTIEDDGIIDLDKKSNDELLNDLVKAMIKTEELEPEMAGRAVADAKSNILKMTQEEARESLMSEILARYKQLGVVCKANGKKVC